MTKFLGSGAFGEVYEGNLRYAADKEQRVAVKVSYQSLKRVTHSSLSRLSVKVPLNKRKWNFSRRPSS